MALEFDGMADARRPLSVLVTWESYEALEEFCAEHGVTMTAMIEVMGRFLGSPQYEPSEMTDRLIEQARQIGAERRRRPKKNGA